MTEQNGSKTRNSLAEAKKALEEARASEDQFKISKTLSNLGFALFQADKFKEGKKTFREAEEICKALDDYAMTVDCLSIQAYAYHNTGQLPTAFEIAQKIEKMAVEENDKGGLIDALATQGQILIDSRDEIGSIGKFKDALELAEEIEDKPRQMKILGAIGQYSLTIASTGQAESYFIQAREIASEIGDRQSEVGYHGNLGIVLEWKEKWAEAAQIFTEVLTYLVETENRKAQLQPLYHLANIAAKQQEDPHVIEYALAGIEAAREVEDFLFSLAFYEKLIPAYYRLGLADRAEDSSKEAIQAARKSRDLEKEVSFRLSLGESYMLGERYEEALEIYQEAQKGARKLNHHDKEAYTIGRIGVCLAELGRLDEAIHHHKIAGKVAKEMDLTALEAEQLAMLAIIYRDLKNPEKALEFANQSLELYTGLEMDAEIGKIQELISELNAK